MTNKGFKLNPGIQYPSQVIEIDVIYIQAIKYISYFGGKISNKISHKAYTLKSLNIFIYYIYYIYILYYIILYIIL